LIPAIVALVLSCSAAATGDCAPDEYCETDWDGVDCRDQGVCVKRPQGTGPELSLPIAAGETIFCAKGSLRPRGSHGVCSPTGRFALDLATPATLAPHVIIAAADGIAYPFGGCSTSNLDRGHSDGCNLGWGNVVHVEHAPGLFTLYAHLASIVVEPGQRVARGQPLGVEGNTGSAGGKHLHFGLQLGKASDVGAGVSQPIASLRTRDGVFSADALRCGDWTTDGTVYRETALVSATPLVADPVSRYLAAGFEPPSPTQPASWFDAWPAFSAGVVVGALLFGLGRALVAGRRT
jgi:hypothetical protein